MSLQEAELIRALGSIGWPGTGQLIEGGWQMVVPTVVDVDQREGAPFPVIVSHIGAIMRKLDGTWPKPRIRVRVKGRRIGTHHVRVHGDTSYIWPRFQRRHVFP
jgi:hypothetical protein